MQVKAGCIFIVIAFIRYINLSDRGCVFPECLPLADMVTLEFTLFRYDILLPHIFFWRFVP